MAFALVNKTIATGTATSAAASPGWTLGAGHLVVAVLGLETSTVVTAPTVTDSLGSTYTLRASQPTDASAAGIFLFDSVLGSGGAGATITASWGGASFKFALAVLEYSFAQSLAVDGTAAARNGAGSNAPSPGSLSLTGSGRLVLCACEVAGVVAYTPSTGFTVEESSAGTGMGHAAVEDATGQSGTVTPGFTLNAAPAWASVAVAYYESAGGARMSYGRGRSVLLPAALTNADYIGRRYGD